MREEEDRQGSPRRESERREICRVEGEWNGVGSDIIIYVWILGGRRGLRHVAK